MSRIVHPASAPLSGAVSVPGDKSIAHRALILGALARGGLRIQGLPDGADVTSTRRCLETLGVMFVEEDDHVFVQGLGEEMPFREASVALDCGNSGTTMRLLSGVLAGQPFASYLVGDESLSRRPMKRIAEPLRKMGARVDLEGGEHAPISIRGKRPLRGLTHELQIPSAQVKSAILLAGLFAEGRTAVKGAVDSRDHTERMLAWLSDGDAIRPGSIYVLRPQQLAGDRDIEIPGDISSAAFLLAAATLVRGSEVQVSGVGLNPSRRWFAGKLLDMGANIERRITGEQAGITDRPWESGEPVGDIRVLPERGQLHSIRVQAHESHHVIDEVPLLAVVASQSRGETRIEGLGELRHKESDRLGCTAAGLAAMGAEVEVEGDDLIVRGPCRLQGASIDTHGDHRLAMAFTVAALVAEGDVELSDADCVAVSYPNFFETLDALVQQGAV